MRASMRAAVRCVLAEDRGAGSVLALVVIAVVLAVTAGLLALVVALAARHHVQADADAAALAAADVASGLAGGVPCEVAARAAELGGSRLAECLVSDGIATVTAVRTVEGVEVRVTSRAGPGLQRLQTRPP